MGQTTGISWTDATFNPWWGCWKIADECKNCYADTTAHRYVSQFGELWGRTSPRRFFGENHWGELRRWNNKAERDGVRRRVFVGSMCDWAEVHPIDEVARQMADARERLWREIRECTALDFLMLTKRPEDAAELIPWRDTSKHMPWPNVWLGVTAGTTASMLKNVPILRTIPAVVRFISCEPILEDIPRHVWDGALARAKLGDAILGNVHWLIAGDESGHHARPAQADWVRSAREAALRHGVAFHFKQWAGAPTSGIAGDNSKGRKIHLPILDGRQWAQFPERDREFKREVLGQFVPFDNKEQGK